MCCQYCEKNLRTVCSSKNYCINVAYFMYFPCTYSAGGSYFGFYSPCYSASDLSRSLRRAGITLSS